MLASFFYQSPVSVWPIMPQRPRPRNYRKRQQEESDDEEPVGVAEEGGVKEVEESEEDSVRWVVLLKCTLFRWSFNVEFVEKSLKKLKSYRNLERNQQEWGEIRINVALNTSKII